MHENDTKNKNNSSVFVKDSRNLTLNDIKGVDYVEIHDRDLDWLRDFFNAHYNGERIPFFRKRFIIKVNDRGNAVMLYVRSLDEDHYQVDFFTSNGDKHVIWTEVIQNSCVCNAEGKYISISYTAPWFEQYNKSKDLATVEIIEYLQNVTRYVIFYINENISRVEKKTIVVNSHSTKKKKKCGGKSRNASNTKTIYIPKKIASVIVKNDEYTEDTVSTPKSEDDTTDTKMESTEKNAKREYNGYTETWETKAHSRRIRDKKTGEVRVIYVRSSTKRRSQELLKKGAEKQKRIILKPRSEDES